MADGGRQRMIRKIVKYTLRLLALLLGLVVLLLVALYLPPVQDALRRKAVTYVEENYHLRLRVDVLRLRFPLRLQVEGVEAVTPTGDTLLAAERLQVRVALLPLLGGEVALRQFTLESTAMHWVDSTGGMDLGIRVGALDLSGGHALLTEERAHLPAVRLRGGDVRLTLFAAPPDTLSDTTFAPLRWKISTDLLALDSIAFALHMPTPTTDLTVNMERGEVDSCAVDLGAQRVTASRVQILRGAYAYLADTTTVTAPSPTPVPQEAPATAPWSILVGQVQLTANRAQYGLPYGIPRPTFDPEHIGVEGLDLTVDSLYNCGSTVRVSIAELRFQERSGLTVTHTEGTVTMDSTGYSVQDFRLTTPASTLFADLTVGEEVATLVPSTPLEAQLALQLGSADLFRVIEVEHALQRQLEGRTLTFDTRLSGRVDDLRLHRLVATIPAVVDFAAEGQVRHATTPQHTAGEVTFGGTLHASRLWGSLLPQGVTLPTSRFRGSATARAGHYHALFALQTDGGKVNVQGSFSPQSDQYAAHVEVDSLPLQRFLPNDSLGRVTLTLNAEGRGFDPLAPTTRASVDLQVTRAEFQGFNYRNLLLTAQLDTGQLTGRFSSNNRGLQADLQLQGSLSPQAQKASLQGVLQRIDLTEMGFTEQPTQLSLQLDASAEATARGSYQARVTLDSVAVTLDSLTQQVPRTALSAAADSAHVEAQLTSGDLRLAFRSDTTLNSLSSAFAQAAANIQEDILAGKIDTDTLGTLLPPFRLDFYAGRNNPLNDYLYQQGVGFARADVTSSAQRGEPFGFRAEVNQLSTAEMTLDTLTAGVGGRNGQLQYFVRLANRPGNLNRMGSLALYGHAEGDSAQVMFTQHNRQGDTGLLFGLQAQLRDSAVTVTLIPQEPIFGFSTWSVNPGNYLRYGFDKRLTADLRLSHADQSFTLQSAADTTLPPGSIRLDINGIHIGKALNLFPSAPPVDGVLGTSIAFGLGDSLLVARGNLSIDTLQYNDQRVGDIGLDFAYRTDTVTGQSGSLALQINHRPALTAQGQYHPTDTASVLHMTADIPGLPLAMATPFLPDGSGSLSGWLRGHIEAREDSTGLMTNGEIRFDSTAVTVAAIGTRFGITETPIILQGNRVLFKDFGLIAPNRQPLTLNGSLDVSDFSHVMADLHLRANDFQLINVPRNRGSMVFGHANANLTADATGPLDALNIRGSADLLSGTEVTYVMQESTNSIETQTQNLVTFTSFNDTTSIVPPRPPAMLQLGGIDMLMNVTIAPDVAMAVYLSEDGQNRINLQGGGSLTYSMNRLGDTRFAGKYELTGGQVRYTPPVISAKDFTITPGGFVSWTGEMTDPSFSIRAVESVRTTVTMEDQSSRQVNFQISILLSGSLENLDIRFDLAAPEDLTLQNQLASLTPEQRQNQAMALLLYNTYTGPGTSAKVNTGNPINSFITKELNQWAQNSLRGVDLSFGIDSYNDASGGADGTRTDYSYKLSKKFFDNRVQVSVGGSVSTGANPGANTAESLVDDISLEYQLTRRDNMYLKLFRQNDYESILEGEVTETGIGFGVRKKVLKLGDLFRVTKAPTAEQKPTRAERKASRKAQRADKRRDKRQQGEKINPDSAEQAAPAVSNVQ